MAWLYEQATGRFLDDADQVVGIGYAGNGMGKNNPLMENVRMIGPIVAGKYAADWMRLVHPRLGRYVIHLAPDAETSAKITGYGRDFDSFYMHGDNPEHIGDSSDGCIVLSLDVRESFWTDLDHDITVVAGNIQEIT